MARLVALLRGINLGAKRRVAMADLRALLEELGYTDVRTVLASGNAVITGPKAKAREKLEKALADRFGMKIDVILRTMKELHAVVDADPFGDEVDEPDALLRRLPRRGAERREARAAARRGLLAGQARRQRARALRLVPGRHAGQPPDEGAGQAGPGRHRDRPQLGHRQQAVGVGEAPGCCACSPSAGSSRTRRRRSARRGRRTRWHERMVRAYHLRSEDDPTQVITLGFFEGTEEELDAMRDTPEWMSGEERRLRRIAPLEESVLLSGVWDVVEEIEPARAPRATPPARSRAGPAGAGRPRPGPRARRAAGGRASSGPSSRDEQRVQRRAEARRRRRVDRRRPEAAARRLDVEPAQRAPGRARDREQQVLAVDAAGAVAGRLLARADQRGARLGRQRGRARRGRRRGGEVAIAAVRRLARDAERPRDVGERRAGLQGARRRGRARARRARRAARSARAARRSARAR